MYVYICIALSFLLCFPGITLLYAKYRIWTSFVNNTLHVYWLCVCALVVVCDAIS